MYSNNPAVKYKENKLSAFLYFSHTDANFTKVVECHKLFTALEEWVNLEEGLQRHNADLQGLQNDRWELRFILRRVECASRRKTDIYVANSQQEPMGFITQLPLK